MDINFLGMQQLQQGRVPFGSASPLPGLNAGERSGGFEEILRRSQNPQASSQAEEAAPRRPNLPAIVQNEKLYELCVELETFMLKTLINSMRSTVMKSDLIDTGMAGQIYEDMLYDEYTKSFAQNANLGFAELAYRELTGNRNMSRF